MTVQSLWTVLEESNCGTPVGVEEFALKEDAKGRSSVLAVDTSIWICEALSSTALSSFHSDPVLYLIYQRSIKLLKLGLHLIFVLEGDKRRISNNDGQELRKRRSGTEFVAATNRTENLLRMLGVTVVRAEAEGEALCALLNQRGIVDGIISNDADVFLFGGLTVYTRFTLKDLENRTVMKYDADKLRATVAGTGARRSIPLDRKDLIAFALLTGSDMCGNGVKDIGYQKAIKFFDACRSLSISCLDKLLSWGEEETKKVVHDVDDDGPSTIRCCSQCLHPGAKDLHKKHGCIECGTAAGEGCFVVTSMEKTVMAIQQKVAKEHFAPRVAVEAYFCPNGNSIPSSLGSVTSKTKTCIATPDAALLFNSSLILKGSSLSSSQDFIQQTLPPLLARLDLFSSAPRNVYATVSNQKYQPFPIRIEKTLIRKSDHCYQVIWAIAIDKQQIEFSTHEFQCLINNAFPRLVDTFNREQRNKQRGLVELERHKKFVGGVPSHPSQQQQREKQFNRSMKPGQRRKRERQFDAPNIRKQKVMISENLPTQQSSDVAMLMNNVPPVLRTQSIDVSHIYDCNTYGGEEYDRLDGRGSDQEKARGHDENSADGDEDFLVSSSDDDQNNKERGDSLYNERIFCRMGGLQVEVTPIIRRNRSTY